MLFKFRKSTVLTVFSILAIVLSACASATPSPTATQAPTAVPAATGTNAPTAMPSTGATIQVTNNATLGNILTDSKGMTLYIFKKDTTPGTSACTGQCATLWPPFTVPAGTTPSAGSGITGTLGTITRSDDNSTQVTINNQPLYYYSKDTNPGDTTGQGFGGFWYVVGSDGNPIMSGAPTEAPTTASTSAPAPTETPVMTSTQASSSTASGTIALLLPEHTTARYETQDRPLFEAKLKSLCPNCNILYNNANQDANAQLSQAQAALTNGAKVLVLDPVDSKAAGAIADLAKAQNVPVIAYDRLISNSDGVNYYISFDNAKVGALQAQALVDALTAMGKTDPHIVMINGDPADNNAALFKQGAHSVFDPLVAAGKLTIDKEYDTPNWLPSNAQNEMQQALTALNNKVDGVYCANDGTAGGAIAAMKAAGISPLPPVTGQDAQLDAIQRILTGEQTMTVYKAIKPEAEDAAILAFDLLTNTPVPASMTNGATTNNGKIDVPSILLTPVVVTKDNIKQTVVADGFWTAQQICTAAYASACSAAGIQ
jgi:D-xylose transport system substrate-binding protein